MKRIIIGAALTLCGCGEAVGHERPRAALESAGYGDVKITAQHGIAPALYGCGKGDAVAFEAVATNPAGKRVNAVVCCGLFFKSCTVRH